MPARPPALATKISLGTKKDDASKVETKGVKTSVPTRLPLTTTHPVSLTGEKEVSRTTKRGKEKVSEDIEKVAPIKRSRPDGPGSMTPVIDVLIKHGDDPPAALLHKICAVVPPHPPRVN